MIVVKLLIASALLAASGSSAPQMVIGQSVMEAIMAAIAAAADGTDGTGGTAGAGGAAVDTSFNRGTSAIAVIDELAAADGITATESITPTEGITATGVTKNADASGLTDETRSNVTTEETVINAVSDTTVNTPASAVTLPETTSENTEQSNLGLLNAFGSSTVPSPFNSFRPSQFSEADLSARVLAALLKLGESMNQQRAFNFGKTDETLQGESETSNSLTDSGSESVAGTAEPISAIFIIASDPVRGKALLSDGSPTAELEVASRFSATDVDQSITADSKPTVASEADNNLVVESRIAAASNNAEKSVASAVISVAVSAPTSAANVATTTTVVPILLDERDPTVGNAFGFRYRSGDGQYRSEKSSIKLPVPGVQAAPGAVPEYETVGEYEFTHPDGTVNRITYTSGIHGYVAQGAMIPTPPPMPVWAIEQIRFAEEQKRLEATARAAALASIDSIAADEAPAAADATATAADEAPTVAEAETLAAPVIDPASESASVADTVPALVPPTVPALVPASSRSSLPAATDVETVAA